MTANARGILIFHATMWIHIDNPTKRLKTPELDDPVEFSENGTAQVPDEVGKDLIDSFATISEHES